MTASQQALRRKVRLAIELNNSLRNQIRVSLFFVGVLQKLRGDTLGVNPGSHKVVSLVAQYANDLRGQRLIQHFDYGFPIRPIAFGYGALINMLTRTRAQGFYVSEKWFVSHKASLDK